MTLLQDLLGALAQKPADVRADFVGHLAFNLMSELEPDSLPASMRADIDRFIERVGFEVQDNETKTRARIDAHFKKNALDAELMRLFDELRAAIVNADTEADEVKGIAASSVLGQQRSLKPVGAEGRKAGTIPGGAMGMMAMRMGNVAVGPSRSQKPTPKSTISR